ncbi:MAG: hypothetical protein GF329_06235 [Candidatus Lokiarchaeota archaeon]|nr:hypothetical protein [Candidatus Lokiarchaeota archaeon]
MVKDKKEFYTAQQIDGHKGIKSPHARELDSIAEHKIEIFENNDIDRIKGIITNKIRARIENIGFGEDFTITLTFFPSVNIHILYYNYEDEEDELFNDSELRFLFSGNRVSWIPTEDLIGFTEAVFDIIENLLRLKKESHKIPAQKTDLLKMAIRQRSEPFEYLKKNDLNQLADFIGGQITLDEDENIWTLSRSFFQGFNIHIKYNYNDKELDIDLTGRNILILNNYARDQLCIHLMNHCLRFLSIQYSNIKFPKIVEQTFSFSFIKANF